MPAEQRGSVYKTSKGYGLRWYDEGSPPRTAGFSSRSEARKWYEDVEPPRMRGDAITAPPVTLPTT